MSVKYFNKNTAWITGFFLFLLSLSLCFPLVFALFDKSSIDRKAFSLAILICFLTASGLMLIGRKREQQPLRKQEAIILVVAIWLGVCFFGSLPYYFSHQYPSLVDAFFESTSGFTTTGASVIGNVEALSKPLHFWRSITHWLGGMGIVLLGLAILPFLSKGGNALYRAEFSGAVAQRLQPRLVQTARSLWEIYIGLTLAAFVAYWAAGMSGFEALCHAFSTLATGGFSTRNASIGSFNSPLIEYLSIVFMFLAGVSFIQHFRVWKQAEFKLAFRDDEFRSYVLLGTGATLIITLTLLFTSELNAADAFRRALFQTTSILTTSGFVTADYNQWTSLAQLVLVLLMFVGGCTASTAGGLKVSRIILMLSVIRREFLRFTEPNGVFKVHTGSGVVPEVAISGLLSMIFIAFVLIVVASLLLAATGLDIISAFSAVIACQFNIGPGLASVGPVENYGHLNAFAKLVLSFCMIAGRLEFYTLIVLFTVGFWKN